MEQAGAGLTLEHAGIRGACVQASAQKYYIWSMVQVIGQARWSIPRGVLTALEVTKIAVFGHG